jgi:hypothetical protein
MSRTSPLRFLTGDTGTTGTARQNTRVLLFPRPQHAAWPTGTMETHESTDFIALFPCSRCSRRRTVTRSREEEAQ